MCLLRVRACPTNVRFGRPIADMERTSPHVANGHNCRLMQQIRQTLAGVWSDRRYINKSPDVGMRSRVTAAWRVGGQDTSPISLRRKRHGLNRLPTGQERIVDCKGT
jgi:hypothetical protein